MSECGGGFTPCRQLRPSSRREHVNASSNHKFFIKVCRAQLLSRNVKLLKSIIKNISNNIQLMYEDYCPKNRKILNKSKEYK